MTNFALPEFFEDPASFSMVLASSQAAFASPFGGSEQVIDRGNDRWNASVSLVNRSHADAARLEAFVAGMRGSTNTVSMYHLQRPEPTGTMRGEPKTNGVLVRASAVPIFTTPGATLRAGDLFGAGGLLFMVQDDCVADGAGNLLVPVVNRVRRALSPLTPVIWDRPSVPFRILGKPPAVQYIPGYSPEVTFDLIEAVP
jgi:hypothetical protein